MTWICLGMAVVGIVSLVAGGTVWNLEHKRREVGNVYDTAVRSVLGDDYVAPRPSPVQFFSRSLGPLLVILGLVFLGAVIAIWSSSDSRQFFIRLLEEDVTKNVTCGAMTLVGIIFLMGGIKLFPEARWRLRVAFGVGNIDGTVQSGFGLLFITLALLISGLACISGGVAIGWLG